MRALLVALPILCVIVSCAGRKRENTPEPATVALSPFPHDTASSLRPQQVPEVAAPGAALPVGYSLTDTTEWGNMLEGGKRAILRREGALIDTVDVDVGVYPIGKDSLVFLLVRTDSVPFFHDSTAFYEDSATEYVLWTPIWRRELRDLLPFFKSDNSSPLIANNSVIYYWGIASPGPEYRVYAMRYDFRTAKLDSLFTHVDDLGSDYRYYLRTPRISDTEVDFRGSRLDRATWRLIPPDPPS